MSACVRSSLLLAAMAPRRVVYLREVKGVPLPTPPPLETDLPEVKDAEPPAPPTLPSTPGVAALLRPPQGVPMLSTAPTTTSKAAPHSGGSLSSAVIRPCRGGGGCSPAVVKGVCGGTSFDAVTLPTKSKARFRRVGSFAVLPCGGGSLTPAAASTERDSSRQGFSKSATSKTCCRCRCCCRCLCCCRCRCCCCCRCRCCCRCCRCCFDSPGVQTHGAAQSASGGTSSPSVVLALVNRQGILSVVFALAVLRGLIGRLQDVGHIGRLDKQDIMDDCTHYIGELFPVTAHNHACTSELFKGRQS